MEFDEHMRYGVAYYPEHRIRKEFELDKKLMVEAGFNVVRMGEFAWCKFEPKEGEYEFLWFDSAVQKLGEVGIDTIICTPTAAPPIWLTEKYAETLYMDNRGVTRPFGGRRHYCYNNPIYRQYSIKIAEKIAKYYGNNPYILGIQIDNELAQEGTGRCQCNICKNKFINWLRQKYKSIDNLNQKWGTIFWGQTYYNFNQVTFPLKSIEPNASNPIEMFFDNPSLRLDFERFCSESLIEYQNLQKDAIRKYTDKIITSNSTGLGTDSIDYYKSYKELDKYAFDLYPDLRAEEMELAAFSYGFARGVKQGNFWIVELACGGGHALWGKQGWLQPYPGAIKQEVIHAFVSGAELITLFHFSAFPFGAEQLDAAILDLDGIPGRRYYEIKQASQDLKCMENILKTSEIRNDVALCFDYDTYWALKIKPVNQEYNYINYCNSIHSCLSQLGIGADVSPFDESICKYKMVIIPTPFVMSESFKHTLKNYVKSGGVILTTFLSAVKDVNNVGIKECMPCGLTELFGIRVTEVEPVFATSVANISIFMDNKKCVGKNKYWTESLESLGADIIGTYEDTFRIRQGVISVNEYGRGKAYYLGTALEENIFCEFCKFIIEIPEIKKVPFELQKGMEVITRYYEDVPVYFVFNFMNEKIVLNLDKQYRNAIENKILAKSIEIGPKGYIILIAHYN